jgi:hypothetical protein
MNSTYYGEKKLLTFGVATQVQSGNTATTYDFLLERKLANAGVLTLEAEYASYDGLGGYDSAYRTSSGFYFLGAYILPKEMGPGKLQLLGKYSKAGFKDGPAPGYQWKTTEFNVNYLLKEFNARIMTFIKNTEFTNGRPDSWQAGLGLQFQI